MERRFDWRLGRAVAAALLWLLLLAIGLPGTGYVIADHAPVPPSMWRVAMFAVHPASFFIFVGEVTIPFVCIIIGLRQGGRLEAAGWSLLGVIVILALLAG